jgi:PhzF family phenazine biosynthesis protein
MDKLKKFCRAVEFEVFLFGQKMTKGCDETFSSFFMSLHKTYSGKIMTTKMPMKCYLFNTFTDKKHQGNPTPVCLLDQTLSSEEMQQLANDFKAPVTAFVEPIGENLYHPIRYFTLSREIPACGHASLGAAFAMYDLNSKEQTTFETIEKILIRTKWDNGSVFMTYPRYKSIDADVPDELMKALGLSGIEASFYCRELQSLFIELKSENEVKQVSPDYQGLLNSSDTIKEVVIMSQSVTEHCDFVLRSFCPWIGIDEDPVTGSIHSVLGPYWQDRLQKNELIAYQASERAGKVFVRPHSHSVEIGGQAILIMTEEIA